MTTTLYHVALQGVRAGIEVSADGIVVDAAPALQKLIGARLDKLERWVARNGGRVRLVRNPQAVGTDAQHRDHHL